MIISEFFSNLAEEIDRRGFNELAFVFEFIAALFVWSIV